MSTLHGTARFVVWASVVTAILATPAWARGRSKSPKSSSTSVESKIDALSTKIDDLGAAIEALSAGAVDHATFKFVFVTKEPVGADLGGRVGGDVRCQLAAQSGGLQGTFLAWLSDPTGSPNDLFTHATVPYLLLDGTRVADDWTDLTDGNIQNPINVDEFGGPQTGSYIWTGTNTNGMALTPNCLDWGTPSSGEQGYIGDNHSTNHQWTSIATSTCEGENYRLYCFQQ